MQSTFFFRQTRIFRTFKNIEILIFYILAFLFPLAAWLFKLLDHFSLLLSCLCSTSIMLSIYVLYLILQQLYIIINSQTWYEYKNNIRIYKIGKNFQSKFQLVFGKQWYLILFSPLIYSLPMGDGMSFDTNLDETRRIGIKYN